MLPPFIEESRLYKHLNFNRLFFHNYPFYLFALGVVLLLLGIRAIDSWFWLSFIIAVLLTVAALSYYYYYFKRYIEKIDAYTPQEYKLDLFSVWGVTGFNLLFIFCFALMATVADRLLPGPVFVGESYTEVVFGLASSVVNGLFSGLSDTLTGIYKRTFDPSYYLPEPGIAEQVYSYAIGFVIDAAFWTSIFDEVFGWREANREVYNILNGDRESSRTITQAENKRNRQLIRKYEAGEFVAVQHQDTLIEALKYSKAKGTISIFLDIMQSTENIVIFEQCLQYFRDNDLESVGRFINVCKNRIKDPEKRACIERFEFRKVKKKRRS
jgi:hypothetical protein